MYGETFYGRHTAKVFLYHAEFEKNKWKWTAAWAFYFCCNYGNK